MAVLEVVKDGHPTLKKSASRIKRVTDETRELACDMTETMVAYNGVGLAANQVARPVRMIIVMHGEDDLRVYLNPKIAKRSRDFDYGDEGCLSFPRLYGQVRRNCAVLVLAQDLDLKPVRIEADGFLARIFQHEIDHLNGITFTERADPDTLRIYNPEEFYSDDEPENTTPEDGAADSQPEAEKTSDNE